MRLKMVLFDLDGTLLPMNQNVFVKKYFSLLAAKLSPYGYEPEKLIHAIWSGIAAMVKNDGAKTNEEAFWADFSMLFGEKAREDIPIFDEFYKNEFAGAKAACGFNPLAAAAIARVKEKGLRAALATNPIFPAVATENRIRWAGLSPDDFELYTTYENSCNCKPNPEYYKSVAARLGVKPEECLMVGNDVTEDMVAETVGMRVFLLTDCLINKNDMDISAYPQGSFADLLQFIEESC